MVDKNESCCPPGCLRELKTSYKPRGVIENLDGLSVYTIGQGEKAILLIHDIFGVDSGRTKEICDEFADAGYLVVMPDFFEKDGETEKDLNEGFFLFRAYSAIKRLWKSPWKAVEEHLNKRVYPFLESKGVKKIGTMGFCWGGFIVFNICADERVSAGVGFHPVYDKFFVSVEKLTEAVKCPQLICPAENDSNDIKEGQKVEKILRKRLGDDVKVKTFTEMQHGFVNRGDMKDPKVEKDAKEAIRLAFEHFEKYL